MEMPYNILNNQLNEEVQRYFTDSEISERVDKILEVSEDRIEQMDLTPYKQLS